MQRWALAAVVMMLFSGSAFATGFMVPNDRNLAGLQLESHRVTVKIADQGALTKVAEVFRNQHNRQLEATFVFPLPEGASVSDFKMYVNGKLVTGEVMEARQARGIYESIVRQMRDPGLLEYVDSRLLKLSVFPILPGSTQEVRLEYAQALKSDDGLVEYVYPLKTPQCATKTLNDFTLSVDITAGAGIKNVYSPTHEVAIRKADDHHATVSFEKSRATLDKDFQLFYALTDKAFGASVISYRKDEKDGYFLLLLSPKVDVAREAIVPKDVAFVIDTSGSMKGDKLKQAKRALDFCVDSLNDGDRFTIISFSGGTDQLFSKPREATSENRRKAAEFIGKLDAEGGTDIHSALVDAVKGAGGSERPYLIVFLTDGQPTVGETGVGEIVDAVKGDDHRSVRVFSFGIGYDVNANLLDELARETNALNQYVHPDEDIEVKVSSFFKKVDEPLLSQVEVDFGDADVYDVYPKHPGDLFRGSQIVMAGRFREPGSTTITLKGHASPGEMTFEYPVDFSGESKSGKFVSSIWAGRKIAYLLGEIRLHGENDELKDEVVHLSKEFGIMTPYTSYLVRETPERVMPMPVMREDVRRQLRSLGYLSDGAPATPTSPSAAAPVPAQAPSRFESDFAYSLSATDSRKASVQASEAYNRLIANDKFTDGRMMTSACGRTFANVSGVWVDDSVTKEMKVVKVKFASDAYFAIVNAAPALKEAFALGDKLVIAAGKSCLAIGDDGKESADDVDVKAVITALSR